MPATVDDGFLVLSGAATTGGRPENRRHHLALFKWKKSVYAFLIRFQARPLARYGHTWTSDAYGMFLYRWGNDIQARSDDVYELLTAGASDEQLGEFIMGTHRQFRDVRLAKVPAREWMRRKYAFDWEPLVPGETTWTPRFHDEVAARHRSRHEGSSAHRTASPPVPEPGAGAGLIAGVLMILHRRRRS